MTEQLPTETHDASPHSSLLDAIENVRSVLGAENVERMKEKYREGRGAVAENERLTADSWECKQQIERLEQQIQDNAERQEKLAPRLQVAQEQEEEMRRVIDWFAQFATDEEINAEPTQADEEELASGDDSLDVAEPRSMKEFRNVDIQRSFGKGVLVPSVILGRKR